ncbi:hypothetical protein SCATT_p04580 (plasmid) [Streptantibioticus cattleyicolor NRRL 8057 = DSM 46488]|uniref:Uncharacterized protein n=1 Tax=Streptantibioticus cattleyicolor (strain ATCC 35852 / DSM 46488 / JCM 4925 / NBRC 14057 / NRRL 8057) TaxID=1003195 RepID=G8XG12_STREN|nr:hypothetical protein SCATT_p04580 [Streptantibioticus cattleyicolor NRRL 8057 = DSM 46488]
MVAAPGRAPMHHEGMDPDEFPEESGDEPVHDDGERPAWLDDDEMYGWA